MGAKEARPLALFWMKVALMDHGRAIMFATFFG
jgi:hypothetical protein